MLPLKEETEWFKRHLPVGIYTEYLHLKKVVFKEITQADCLFGDWDLVEVEEKLRDVVFSLDETLVEEGFHQMRPLFALLDTESHKRFTEREILLVLAEVPEAGEICLHLHLGLQMYFEDLAKLFLIEKKALSAKLSVLSKHRMINAGFDDRGVYYHIAYLGRIMLEKREYYEKKAKIH